MVTYSYFTIHTETSEFLDIIVWRYNNRTHSVSVLQRDGLWEPQAALHNAEEMDYHEISAMICEGAAKPVSEDFVNDYSADWDDGEDKA